MNLPPFIGSKKIAIPDQIVAALLSQSCDAKEIVLQLRETIKVEDASLEQPDSETKTLIRCVARKAKESNRLDVFKHLREITPAGCTGESVIGQTCYRLPFHECFLREFRGASTPHVRTIIHLIPKWPPFKYSFVFIQISPCCIIQDKILFTGLPMANPVEVCV